MIHIGLPRQVSGRSAANVRDKVVRGRLADLRRMPRVEVESTFLGTLYRYAAVPGVAEHGDPVLIVPPLGAPDFAFDLRRGCSLVEHLLGQGRRVYLVDYGAMDFADRTLGLESWVDDLLPSTVAAVRRDSGGSPVHLVGWSLGGLFCVITAAAHDLPAASVTAVTSPFDVAAVPLIAPLRPLAQISGGHVLTGLYRTVGTLPAPAVKWAFQLSSVDKMVMKPLAIASNLHDRDFLEQVEAVGHLMDNMHGYPGRAFGQIFHLLLRANDLAGGRIDLAGRSIHLSDVSAPVLLVAGTADVLAPARAVRTAVDMLTGSAQVRYVLVPGGHLGALTGRQARATTWEHLLAFLAEHDRAGQNCPPQTSRTGARTRRQSGPPVKRVDGPPAPA